VSNNVTTLSHYKSDIQESILTIFGTTVTEKVGNQKVLFLTSPTLSGEMKTINNSILSLRCCTVALPDFNQSLA